tara:strand:+ start:10472 stop:10798 length:327 start_codon:yes stop_codon:yes gene_type:complete
MKVLKIEDMIGGWFVGDFEPSIFKTSQFEAGYKLHKKGESWPVHYHKEADEITFLLKGEMNIQGKTLKSGDVFLLSRYEVADPVFVTNCEVFVIKTPSVIGDKFNCHV